MERRLERGLQEGNKRSTGSEVEVYRKSDRDLQEVRQMCTGCEEKVHRK